MSNRLLGLINERPSFGIPHMPKKRILEHWYKCPYKRLSYERRVQKAKSVIESIGVKIVHSMLIYFRKFLYRILVKIIANFLRLRGIPVGKEVRIYSCTILAWTVDTSD